MANTAVNNKRIAKNTLLLYFRMLFMMVVSLYTSRVVLNALGVEDFGIYNVVGGVVAMMSFFNNSMATATQRYLNYEMGKNNTKTLNDIFSTSVICYGIIIILALLIAETFGLWFIKHKLTMPNNREFAAFWVFQFSILTFIFNMLSVPYNAAIIAHEKMSAFAYISILEAIGKLTIAYLITISPIDKLIFYSILICCISIIIRLIYTYYCRIHFSECKLKWIWNVNILKNLFGFSSWMLAGTLSQMFSTQGINIIINIFFGPIYNAARAIAMQIYGTVNGFVANFMTATRPQMIKSYAQGDINYTYKLIFSSSKIAFYLLFILSVSILFETQNILNLWLKRPPEFASLFTQLILIDLFITTAYSPIAVLSQASGKIKIYQLTIMICFALIFIMSLIAFKLGCKAYSTFIILIIIDFIGLFVRLIVLNKTVGFPIHKYLKETMLPIAIVFILTLLPCYLIQNFLKGNGLTYFIARILSYISCTLLIIYSIGLNKNEKKSIHKMIHLKLKI